MRTRAASLVIRHMRPRWLREKLFYRARSRFALKADELFDSARLDFAPGVRLRLLPTDFGHQVIAWTGFYDLAVSRRVAALARRGGLMVDVGANYRYYSCLWAGGREQNCVTAFEVLEGADRRLSAHRVRNVFFEQFPQRMDELGIAHDAAGRFVRQRGYRVDEISSGEFHAVPDSGK